MHFLFAIAGIAATAATPKTYRLHVTYKSPQMNLRKALITVADGQNAELRGQLPNSAGETFLKVSAASEPHVPGNRDSVMLSFQTGTKIGGETKITSSPRIVVLEGENASISQTEEGKPPSYEMKVFVERSKD